MALSDDIERGLRDGSLGKGSEDEKSPFQVDIENIVNHGLWVSTYYNTLVTQGMPHQSALALTGELVRNSYARGGGL